MELQLYFEREAMSELVVELLARCAARLRGEDQAAPPVRQRFVDLPGRREARWLVSGGSIEQRILATGPNLRHDGWGYDIRYVLELPALSAGALKVATPPLRVLLSGLTDDPWLERLHLRVTGCTLSRFDALREVAREVLGAEFDRTDDPWVACTNIDAAWNAGLERVAVVLLNRCWALHGGDPRWRRLHVLRARLLPAEPTKRGCSLAS